MCCNPFLNTDSRWQSNHTIIIRWQYWWSYFKCIWLKLYQKIISIIYIFRILFTLGSGSCAGDERSALHRGNDQFMSVSRIIKKWIVKHDIGDSVFKHELDLIAVNVQIWRAWEISLSQGPKIILKLFRCGLYAKSLGEEEKRRFQKCLLFL